MGRSVGDEDVEFVGAARNRMDPRALRRADIPNPPPAMPPVGETRFPGCREHAAIGSNDEGVELIRVARDDASRRARCGDPPFSCHQPCHQSVKAGSHAAV